ncbi:anti-sigma factor family protein [Nocardioides renjunii]|uniref:anti-sigma factor family protein n=1 Tax=Nocardioides renjunii TaxID=3095075 RepID=UPI002AFDCB11|nr:zf-HC2 domain-containing protein [Nocardioides sp. S-34]WQQ21351.1 zf-HC2 domain-containing protein [Nocardioides sp. S-34]
MTHLGSRVSALLDGHLSAEEEERCWAHVHGCHSCRDLVEQEGWVKTQLAQLSHGPAQTSHDFKSALRGRCSSLEPSAGGALAAPPFPTSQHRSRRGLVAIGGGAASACVVGVLALGVAGGPRVEPRPPVTDLTRPVAPVAPVAPAVKVDDRSARGPVSPSRTPLAERLVAIREKIAP